MGSELRNLSDSVSEEGGSDETSESPFSIVKLFDDLLPYYISIGMTPDEYWNGDPSLVRAYREAEKRRLRQKNYELWLQGRYVYDAVMRLIPSLQMLKPREPLPYLEEPLPLTQEEYEARLVREQKKKQEALRAYMQSFVKNNKKNEDEKDG